MKNKLFPILFLMLLLTAACGRKTVNYKQKMTGIWQVSNVGDILKASGDDMNHNADAIRNATINFQSNGKMIAKIGKLEQKGTWTVAEDGTALQMKADGIRFDERLPLNFDNELTIIIKNTGKKIVLKKING